MSAVTVDAGAAPDADLLAVLASLPDDFVLVRGGARGEVVVVDGGCSDWPVRVQESLATARGILLREPGTPSVAPGQTPEDVVREVARRADAAGVPVILDRRWSGAVGVEAFADEFAGAVRSSTSVTVLLVEDDAARSHDDGVLDALDLARAAGAPADSLEHVHGRAGSWSAWGRTAGGAALHLQGVHTAAGAGAVLTASSATVEAVVSTGHPRSASPAVARRSDAAGERTLPTDFEPAARTAWRRLHQRLADDSGAEAGVELEAVADDLALLGAGV